MRHPASTRYLIWRKRRITHALVKADHRRLDGVWLLGVQIREPRPIHNATIKRTKLYRLDAILEARGVIKAHTWYPGAKQDPGLNANYRRGRVVVWMQRVHFTVGNNSRGLIRDKGLAQFLIDRDGTVWEFAPADAVCSDACEWNIYGFGWELEALDRGQFTPAQITELGKGLAWGCATYGIPNNWRLGPDYDGSPRLAVGSEFHGIANHDGLHERACDEHYDGATPGEAAAMQAVMAGGAPPAPDLTLLASVLNARDEEESYA